MKYHVYWLPKGSCFEFFGNGKYGLLLSQKFDEMMIFTDYWKIFVLKFSVVGNTVFFLWYLLGLLDLTMILQNFGNMDFRAVSNKRSLFQSSPRRVMIFLILSNIFIKYFALLLSMKILKSFIATVLIKYRMCIVLH